MTTFSIYKWEDGRLLLEYQNGAEHARLFFSPSSLPDLASCASSALAEQNSRVMSRCKCDLPEIANANGIECPHICAHFEDNACAANMCVHCEHDRACHSTQSTDQEGK